MSVYRGMVDLSNVGAAEAVQNRAAVVTIGATAAASGVAAERRVDLTAVTTRMACPAGNERSLNALFTQHCKIACYIGLLGI